MNELFLKIINMSISASWIVLAVLLLRFLFKKAPKWVNVLLWGIVAVRLICPFSFESALSLIPSAETISPTIMMDQTPSVQTGIPVINRVINPVINDSFAPAPEDSANPLQIWIPVLSIIWLIGVAILLLYTAVSYWRLRRKVSEAVILRDNIYQSENVGYPFVLGIIKPRVYLTYKMDEQNLGHVVAHEQAHIRRRDHWWKPLGFLLLTIHWFNPLMWLAYVMLCRDIELACDEKVIKELGNEQRADYTQALVACSVNRRMIAACPLAFGEVGVKERVKSVMNYKKPAFWVIVLAIITCVVVAVCFLTNPSNDEQHAPEPFGHIYKPEEILFEAPQYSFVYSIDTAPRYQFTSDYAMFVSENALSQDGSMEWTQQKGGFEEVKITTENFDNYFDMSGFLISHDRWSKFRSSIKKAWRLDIENDENNVFYYLISTKSGEVYLTYGYHDPESETDSHSDDSSIRWLFKLARTDLLTCNAISEGTNAFVELVCFPDKIDRDTDNWPVAQINESGILQFTLDGDANTLEVSEDYYRKSENSTFIEQNSFEIGRNDDGLFTIDIARRESLEDHVNYFIKIKGQSDVYAMKVVFAEYNHGDIGNSTEPAPVVIKWFDYLDAPNEMQGAYRLEISLPEFPNVTFRWSYATMEAVVDNEILPLYTGMPIWNTYFYDLTGDGLPELCSTISFGSGMIDDHIIIYDYANGASYSLQDRGVFDYRLRQGEDDELLYVDKSNYFGGGVVAAGRLVFQDDCLQILGQNVPNDAILKIINPTDDPNFSYGTAVEKIYEDENNEYFLSGLYSRYVIVHYTDGTQEDIKAALNSGRATIADLDKFGIRYWAEPKADPLDAAIAAAILEHYRSDKPDGLIHVESHVLLANEEMSGTPLFGADSHVEKATVYLLVHHAKYSTYGGVLKAVGGSYVPAAITFKVNDSGEYILEEYWEPRDGSYYAKDIREKFPGASADEALNDQAYIEDIKTQTYNKALAYLNSTVSVDVRIAELLDEIQIQSSPALSSNPGDYIRANETEYDELLGYGEFTLRYCFSEFLQGGQTDLRGHIMALACEDIMLTWGEAYVIEQNPSTGQDRFDEFRRNAESLADQFGPEELEKSFPGAFVLLQMSSDNFATKGFEKK